MYKVVLFPEWKAVINARAGIIVSREQTEFGEIAEFRVEDLVFARVVKKYGKSTFYLYEGAAVQGVENE